MKKTRLTEEFSFEEFQQMYGDSAVVLFVLSDDGRLTICTTEAPPEPKAGHLLISLVKPVPDVSEDET